MGSCRSKRAVGESRRRVWWEEGNITPSQGLRENVMSVGMERSMYRAGTLEREGQRQWRGDPAGFRRYWGA